MNRKVLFTFLLAICAGLYALPCKANSLDALNGASGAKGDSVSVPDAGTASQSGAATGHQKSVANGHSVSAADFGVFSLGPIHYSHSDFEGRTGAVSNVHFDNFALGAKLSHSMATLMVGGSADLSDGTVFNGGVVAGGIVRASGVDLRGTVTQHAGVAYGLNMVARALLADSDCLAALPADAIEYWNDGMVLSARPGLARTVFRITAARLAEVSKVILSAQAGTTLVVDVTGASASLSNKELRMVGGGNVIFNFAAAQKLLLEGVSVPGVVLAPRAATKFNSGQVNGRIYVGNLYGNGQVNDTGSTALQSCGCDQ